MATTGVFNGTNLLLKVDGSTLGHTTSCTLSISHDLPDATTKDSGGWAESISGLRSGEVSFDGLVDYSEENNVVQMVDLILERQKVEIVFGTTDTGDVVFTADAWTNSIEQVSDMEASVTYSGSLTITGPIIKSTNA